MTDRELLELAAKAYNDPEVQPGHPDFTRWIGYDETLGCDVMVRWNPLADDGDALRLATRLCMSISTGPCEASADTIQGALRGAFFRASTLTRGQAEAVRRVIVEAAAEVGRAM